MTRLRHTRRTGTPTVKPARRALMGVGLLLTVLAWPLQSTPRETPKNWWFYLHNDMADELATLLADGADPNLRDEQGQPALLRAVERNAWRVFDLLANDARVNLNIENPAGETALMYLALSGQSARAHTLIRRGAQVNRLGWTPLHYAASRAQVAVARLLLSAGAMPNAPSPQGRTPLMMAAYAGNAEMVQLLLTHGADPTTRDAQGLDAADWAQRQNESALATELRRIINERLTHYETLRRHAAPLTDHADGANGANDANGADVEVFPVY